MSIDSINKFMHYISKHTITIDPKKRLIGIRDVMIGWAMIAAATVFFKVPLTSIPAEINFAFQYITGILLVTFGSLLYGIFTGKWLDFILIRKDESLIGKVTLSLRKRISLIYIRGILASAGYVGFELAKDRIGIVENSAIQVALLTFFILRQRFNLFEWIGIFIAILGISCVLYYDAETSNQLWTIWGYAMGGASAICLAILIILSSIIVKYDPPVRVTFHQCLCGLILALSIILFSENWSAFLSLTPDTLFDAFFSGVCYTIALILFLRAFLFIEPYVIAMSGFSLVVFTSIFESFVNQQLVTSRDLLSSVLIAIGCGILIFHEYKKESNKVDSGNSLDKFPFLSQKRNKLLDLKNKFAQGETNKYEYISEMQENLKVLFDLSSLIKQRPIEQITIENGSVVFKLELHAIELEVDRTCRSSPFEILHFGHYEEEKFALITNLLQDGNMIFDVGAQLGWYSLLLAKQFPKSKIHAFEPFKPNVDILKRNIKRNQAFNVIPYYLELADSTTGDIPLGIDQYQAVRKLDAIVPGENIEWIDFIKCNTEENDIAVLEGAKNTITRFLPILALDLYWKEKIAFSPTDIIHFLKSYGYDCFSISQSRLKLKKITSIDYGNREKTPCIFLHKQRHQKLIRQFAEINI